MRDIIQKQLDAVAFAKLTNLDPATGHCFIPKYSEPKYEIGKCYLVKVAGTVVNNTTSILATNWNKCTAPAYQYLKVGVARSMGKNIYVDSIAYDFDIKQDINAYWSGWLCIDDLTQLAVL